MKLYLRAGVSLLVFLQIVMAEDDGPRVDAVIHGSTLSKLLGSAGTLTLSADCRLSFNWKKGQGESTQKGNTKIRCDQFDFIDLDFVPSRSFGVVQVGKDTNGNSSPRVEKFVLSIAFRDEADLKQVTSFELSHGLSRARFKKNQQFIESLGALSGKPVGMDPVIYNSNRVKKADKKEGQK